ncbi:hypothetical protein ONE63_005411 [Megalurothrips usitatus]|nr:hypothetical protein ONE63_005411 [Megalurothrips usitatus]
MYLRLCLRFALLEVALALALAALVPPEPRRPPQAECAVSLLLQSAPSALVLVALDGWADDDFLGQLAADVPVSVVTDPGRARALLGKGAVGGLAQGLVLVAAPRMMNVSHEYERLATNTIFW